MTEIILNNVFCIVILGILLLSVYIQNANGEIMAKRFSTLLLAALSYLICNLLSEVMTGKVSVPLLFTVNLFAFFAIDMTVLAFVRYLAVMLEKTGKSHSTGLKIVTVSCFVRMAMVVVLAATGNLFSIENGIYVEQFLCSLPYMASGVIMVELLIVITANKTCFTIRQYVVIILYLILPVPPIALELYFNLYSLTGFSITLSILLIFVLIQSSALEQGKIRESVLEEISSTDLLTNLNNRRSYYHFISDLAPQQNVGILFCDINGLKYTNDHFGHAAGDELIVNFANLLRTSFRNDEIFRISGDEFIVIIPNVLEDSFSKRVDEFQNVILANKSIAAAGSAYGTRCCLDRLLSEAEKNMYKSKSAYYQQAGIADERSRRHETQ